MIINIPNIKLKNDKIFIIFKLSSPKFFKTIISFWSINLMKANCAAIRNINGKILNIIEGIFKKVYFFENIQNKC